MPLLRTDTGCRWRKTLVSMTTTRLRRSRGAGWRKMLFHTCELRMKSPTAMGIPSGLGSWRAGGVSPPDCCTAIGGLTPPARLPPLDLDERLGVGPLAALLLELAALIDDDLAVVADAHGPALQRPGGGALEVDAGDVEAGAVAGALE